MFFTLRYHPNDKNSADAERIRSALRQRGFEWEEIESELGGIFGDTKQEVELDCGFFYRSCCSANQVEMLLSHITFENGAWFYDGIEKETYNQQQIKKHQEDLAAGRLDAEEVDD